MSNRDWTKARENSRRGEEARGAVAFAGMDNGQIASALGRPSKASLRAQADAAVMLFRQDGTILNLTCLKPKRPMPAFRCSKCAARL